MSYDWAGLSQKYIVLHNKMTQVCSNCQLLDLPVSSSIYFLVLFLLFKEAEYVYGGRYNQWQEKNFCFCSFICPVLNALMSHHTSCSGLTVDGCQTPTQLFSQSASSAEQGRK